MSTLKTNNIQHVDRSDPSIIINTDGSVNIAGTMTYEDVTNVDAVGIITGRDNIDAQKQVHVGTGVSVKAGGLNVTAGITTVQALQATTGTFSGDVSIADKIIHTGDTDTAIRFPSANVISFEAGGSESFRVDTTGKLLVGQTSDSDGQLCMAGVLAFSAGGSGTASGANARPNISRGNDGQLILAAGKDAGSSIRFDVAANASTNAAEVMRIAADGTVGIATISPAGKVDVHGSGSSAIIRARRLDGNGGYNLFEGYSDVNAASTFYVSQNGLGYFNQRVNIGTSDAGYGDADDLNIATSSHTGMTIRSGTSSLGTIAFSDGTSGQAEYKGFVQYNHSQDTLHLGSAHQSKATINADGNANFTGIVTATQVSPTLIQLSHKNIIINGDMRIAQRGTSSTSSGYKTVDRFKMTAANTSATLTQEQVDVSSGTSPYVRGFRKAYRITNAGQNANNQGYVYMLYQIEAQDIATSGWRYMYDSTADDHITVSFWVKASVTQTYLFFIHSVDGTTKEFNHLISLTGGAWTKVSITVPGNSGITINNDNGAGLNLYWCAYLGDHYTSGSTVDQWVTHAGYTSRPDMGSTWWTTSNATFELTGVQLEVGKQSTPFEHRLLSEELLRCQRYYFDVVQVSGTNETFGFHGAVWQENNGSIIHIRYPVQMRTTPAFGSTNGTEYWRYFGGNDLATAFLDGNGLVNNLTKKYGGEIYAHLSSGTGAIGRTCWVRGKNTSAKAYYDAEF